jgi:hypothetical protein
MRFIASQNGAAILVRTTCLAEGGRKTICPGKQPAVRKGALAVY